MFKEKFYTQDLVNAAEEIVFEVIDNTIQRNDITFCQCDICIQDIAAITLNSLPAVYESSFLDKIDRKTTQQQKLQALHKQAADAVKDAIALVNRNAHH